MLPDKGTATLQAAHRQLSADCSRLEISAFYSFSLYKFLLVSAILCTFCILVMPSMNDKNKSIHLKETFKNLLNMHVSDFVVLCLHSQHFKILRSVIYYGCHPHFQQPTFGTKQQF